MRVLPHTSTGSLGGDSIRHLLPSLGRCSSNLTGIGSGEGGGLGWGWFGVIRGAIRIKPIRASVGPLLLPEVPRQMGRLISWRNGTCHPDPSGQLPPPSAPPHLSGEFGGRGVGDNGEHASEEWGGGGRGRGGAGLNVTAH